MSTSFVIATLVTVLCLDHVTCYLLNYNCDANPYVDGCSIPADLPYFYKDVFRPDCNKHDICYACGAHAGISRSQCDSRFYDRIKYRCKTDSQVSSETWCKMVTFDYYAAVRIGGSSHYPSSSPSWCSNSWVNSCL